MKVEGVSYDVDWSKFRKGRSIFVPCLNCSRVKKELHAMFYRLKLRVLAKVVIEDGVRGLRIWRL